MSIFALGFSNFLYKVNLFKETTCIYNINRLLCIFVSLFTSCSKVFVKFQNISPLMLIKTMAPAGIGDEADMNCYALMAFPSNAELSFLWHLMCEW